MHSPGALARRGGAPARELATPRRQDGLCSFCLSSDVRPLAGRTDDSAEEKFSTSAILDGVDQARRGRVIHSEGVTLAD